MKSAPAIFADLVAIWQRGRVRRRGPWHRTQSCRSAPGFSTYFDPPAAVNGKRPLAVAGGPWSWRPLAVWIAMNTYWDYEMVDNPPRGEAIHNRYYAFEHLAQRLAVHNEASSHVADIFPQPTGVLLVDDLRGGSASQSHRRARRMGRRRRSICCCRAVHCYPIRSCNRGVV